MAALVSRRETLAVYVEQRTETYVKDVRRDPFKKYDFTRERLCWKNGTPIDASTMDKEIALAKKVYHVRRDDYAISLDMTPVAAPKTGTFYTTVNKITHIVTKAIQDQS